MGESKTNTMDGLPGISTAHCSRPNNNYGNRASCSDVVMSGFLMGAGLGSVVGVLFGGMSIMGEEAQGQRARLFLKAVGGSSLSFGVFLAAGSALRCEQAMCEGQPIPARFPSIGSTWSAAAPSQALPAGGLSAIWQR